MEAFILKRYLLGFLILSICFSCNNKKRDKDKNESTMEMTAETKPMEIEIVENYFTKNDMAPRVIQYFTIDNQDDFNKQFGIAKTMDNKVSSIDFKNNRIGAIVLPTTDKNTSIEITEAERFGSGAIITYEINEGDKQSFSITPTLIFKLPADNTLKTLEFKSNGDSKMINIPSI